MIDELTLGAAQSYTDEQISKVQQGAVSDARVNEALEKNTDFQNVKKNVSELNQTIVNNTERIEALEKGEGGSNANIDVSTSTIMLTKGNGGAMSMSYYDEIDNAWLTMSMISAGLDVGSDAGVHLMKIKEDGTRFFSPSFVELFPTKVGTARATDIKRFDDCYMLSLRSTEPNIPSDGMNNDSIWGYVALFKADDLSFVQSIPFNAKCSNVNVVNQHYLKPRFPAWVVVSCQMSYFQLFKVTKNEDGTYKFDGRTKTCFTNFTDVSGATDLQTDITEFQQAKVYVVNGKSLLISAGFADGIHIVDFTPVASTGKRGEIYNFSFKDNKDLFPREWSDEIYNAGKARGSTFSLDIDYPYVYCTFAQPTAVINAYKDGLGDFRVQGMLILDITDLSNIQAQFYRIPLSDCQSMTDSDPKPCCLTKCGNSVYLGMGEKGVARFEVDGMNAEYKGLIATPKTSNIRYVTSNSNFKIWCSPSESVPLQKYEGNGFYVEGKNKAMFATLLDVSKLD